jgi:2-(3-amino-3-carboxypropyl)histidine synthase
MDAGDPSTALVATAADPSQSAKKKAPKRFIHTPIPPSILSDPTLAAAATSLLPAAYNFELPKTAHRIRASGARRAALLPNVRRRATNSWAAVRDTFFSTKVSSLPDPITQ